jgi:hypothetical protein
MEQQAKAFWSRTAAVRARFARSGAASKAPAATAPATPAPPAGPAALAHLAALKELKGLLDQGILTQGEFEQQKAVLLGQSGPARPALAAPKAKPETKPRVVGCPRCQSKLRASKPGVVQCPKCQAKVRVAKALFQA